MKYAFAGALLVAGAMAVPAWQETQTIEQTVVATITSCGPEVTNCPASSTAAWTHPTGGWGSWSGSWSDSWTTSTPVTSATSTPVTSATSTPVTSATSTPVISATTPVGTAPVVKSSSVSGSVSKSTPVSPVGTSAPPAGPVASGTGVKPSGSGPKPSGTGSYTSIPSNPVSPYTGGAAQNAAGLIAGVGAIAAFFL